MMDVSGSGGCVARAVQAVRQREQAHGRQEGIRGLPGTWDTQEVTRTQLGKGKAGLAGGRWSSS